VKGVAGGAAGNDRLGAWLPNNHGRGAGVGLGLGSGLDLGEGVGRGVGVAVAVAVAVAVGEALGVAVAVGLAVGVAVAVAVGVGVGVLVPAGAWIATVLGAPVLKYPTVALASSGGWSASNRKLYNVPQRIAFAFWFTANVSQFQVMESDT